MSYSNCKGCKHSGSSRSSGVCFWCNGRNNWTPSDGYLMTNAIDDLKEMFKPKEEIIVDLKKEIEAGKSREKQMSFMWQSANNRLVFYEKIINMFRTLAAEEPDISLREAMDRLFKVNIINQ